MRTDNIVVGMDFSASSDAALRLATSLARESGAMLHIVHVREPFTAYRPAARYGPAPVYPETADVRRMLDKAVPSDERVRYRHRLVTGDHVAKEILKVADEVKADLIMGGTHGRTVWSRFLTGSVAEALIRRSRCPVLTVKHPSLVITEPVAGPLPS